MHFLNHDRADSAFSYIFAYVYENGSQKHSETFEELIRELFSGLCPGKSVLDKLRAIHERAICSQSNPQKLTESFLNDFGKQKEVLVAVFRLLLRYSTDEGMLSKRDCSRLNQIFNDLQLTDEDLYELTADEREIVIRLVLNRALNANSSVSSSLHKSYEILESQPDDSDRTLQKNYRRLAKRLHPDRISPSTELDHQQSGFLEIQEAYELIMKARKA